MNTADRLNTSVDIGSALSSPDSLVENKDAERALPDGVVAESDLGRALSNGGGNNSPEHGASQAAPRKSSVETNTVILLQRVCVSDVGLDLECAAGLIEAQCERATGDRHFGPLTLSSLMLELGGDEYQAVLFAKTGTAVIVGNKPDCMQAVYIALGSCDAARIPELLRNLRRDADIDFLGTIGYGAFLECPILIGESGAATVLGDTATGHLSYKFEGEQNELFAQIEQFAVLVPTHKRQLGIEWPLSFETFHRWDVSTHKRPAPKQLHEDELLVAVPLGEGFLLWLEQERYSDRWGLVFLAERREENAPHVPLHTCGLVGRRGRLVVQVLEVRDEPVLGDVFRWLMPERPQVGEIFELGEGTIMQDGAFQVGCRPDDGRPIDWLNPKALFRAKLHLVRLWFLPAEEHGDLLGEDIAVELVPESGCPDTAIEAEGAEERTTRC